MKWVWEYRGEGDFTPPQIATFLEGWVQPKADLKSDVPKDSEVFTREIIQNFIDAARKEKEFNPDQAKPSLTFRFIELSGHAAKSLAEKLDLKSISDRYSSLEDSIRQTRQDQSSSSFRNKHLRNVWRVAAH
jgi:hypothetical protein